MVRQEKCCVGHLRSGQKGRVDRPQDPPEPQGIRKHRRGRHPTPQSQGILQQYLFQIFVVPGEF